MTVQRPLLPGREEFENELRDLLTKDVPADRNGYPSPSAIRKADDLVAKILSLYDRCANR